MEPAEGNVFSPRDPPHLCHTQTHTHKASKPANLLAMLLVLSVCPSPLSRSFISTEEGPAPCFGTELGWHLLCCEHPASISSCLGPCSCSLISSCCCFRAPVALRFGHIGAFRAQRLFLSAASLFSDSAAALTCHAARPSHKELGAVPPQNQAGRSLSQLCSSRGRAAFPCQRPPGLEFFESRVLPSRGAGRVQLSSNFLVSCVCDLDCVSGRCFSIF